MSFVDQIRAVDKSVTPIDSLPVSGVNGVSEGVRSALSGLGIGIPILGNYISHHEAAFLTEPERKYQVDDGLKGVAKGVVAGGLTEVVVPGSFVGFAAANAILIKNQRNKVREMQFSKDEYEDVFKGKKYASPERGNKEGIFDFMRRKMKRWWDSKMVESSEKERSIGEDRAKKMEKIIALFHDAEDGDEKAEKLLQKIPGYGDKTVDKNLLDPNIKKVVGNTRGFLRSIPLLGKIVSKDIGMNLPETSPPDVQTMGLYLNMFIRRVRNVRPKLKKEQIMEMIFDAAEGLLELKKEEDKKKEEEEEEEKKLEEDSNENEVNTLDDTDSNDVPPSIKGDLEIQTVQEEMIGVTDKDVLSEEGQEILREAYERKYFAGRNGTRNREKDFKDLSNIEELLKAILENEAVKGILFDYLQSQVTETTLRDLDISTDGLTEDQKRGLYNKNVPVDKCYSDYSAMGNRRQNCFLALLTGASQEKVIEYIMKNKDLFYKKLHQSTKRSIKKKIAEKRIAEKNKIDDSSKVTETGANSEVVNQLEGGDKIEEGQNAAPHDVNGTLNPSENNPASGAESDGNGSNEEGAEPEEQEKKPLRYTGDISAKNINADIVKEYGTRELSWVHDKVHKFIMEYIDKNIEDYSNSLASLWKAVTSKKK